MTGQEETETIGYIGELQARTTLIGAGFPPDEIDYGMTLLERDVILLWLVKNKLQEQKSQAMTMMTSIAGIFSADASGKLLDALTDSEDNLQDLIYKRVGIDPETVPEAAPPKQDEDRAPSKRQLQRDIAKLDKMGRMLGMGSLHAAMRGPQVGGPPA